MQAGAEMTSEKQRLFFAVNLPDSLKREIAARLLPLLPKDGLRKVLPENLHVTMHFLGYLPKEAVKELKEKVESLKDFGAFEAELNCVGHFKGKVLWLGFGKGTEEFGLLNRKLQDCLGTHDERFHAHVTLARNRGLGRGEVQALVEGLRKELQPRLVQVKGIELMLSKLRKSGPVYSVIFSLPFTEAVG